MSNTTTITLTILSLATLNACSRDYSPDAKASGEQIYQEACVECHQPDDKGAAFHLDAKNTNPIYIAHKVKSGSLMMPSFPNLKTADINKLTVYVLEHSASK